MYIHYYCELQHFSYLPNDKKGIMLLIVRGSSSNYDTRGSMK